MPEYTVVFDKQYKTWVLYECLPDQVLFQQAAMNHELTKDDVKEAEAWANAMIHSWGYETFVTVKEN